jgi:hypothetical protein
MFNQVKILDFHSLFFQTSVEILESVILWADVMLRKFVIEKEVIRILFFNFLQSIPQFQILHRRELATEYSTEITIHATSILDDLFEEGFTLFPPTLERSTLLGDLVLHLTESVDDILHLILELRRGEIVIEDFHLLILRHQTGAEVCHRLDLSAEHHGDREDIRPLDEPDSLIETELVDLFREDGSHEDRDVGIHTEAVFLQLLDPAITPCLGIF